MKRADKNIADRHKSEIDLAMIMYVAMEARAERAEAVGVADRLRIRLLQRRVCASYPNAKNHNLAHAKLGLRSELESDLGLF